MKKIIRLIRISVSVFVLLCILGILMIITALNESKEAVPATVPENSEIQEGFTEEGEHSHFWETKQYRDPVCEKEGLRILSCRCGEKIEEVIPALTHEFEGGTCVVPSTCKYCGTDGEKKDHEYRDAVCTVCKKEVKKPVFVFGKTFDFDDSEESITKKLGAPTEILTEGNIRSLVYENADKLTVFQLDGQGLWGVFTMDPNAFFKLSSKVISYSSFTGQDDTKSDATYQLIGGFRVFGFSDSIGDDKCYALWVHYSDLSYHYAMDSNIHVDYTAQSKLSFYYVNALRSRHGLAPLSWSHVGEKVSLEYAEKMAKENFFAHDYQIGQRLTQKGLVWKSCGENLSQGYTNAFFVNDAYYNSTDHRSNILNETFTQVGIAFYLKTDDKGPLYVLGAQTYYN